MKRIAVLTSGGDAPGMNAAIRAVVRSAKYSQLTVFGVNQGYMGLLQNDLVEMSVYSVADVIQRGGTILQTSRTEEMKTDEGISRAIRNLESKHIDTLIVIGGDGSYYGALALAEKGMDVITIPATIDNDLACSDLSIGFDTAVNTAIDAVNRIRDTSSANNRVDVVQVMGRNSGNLALYSGLAGGAEAIVIPEIAISIKDICEKMMKGKRRGKLHSIIVYAEGCGDLDGFCMQIENETQMSVRKTVLGYIQRGGSPTASDRILASRLGAAAIELVLENKSKRAVCSLAGQIVDIDLKEALQMTRRFEKETFEIAMKLSI